MFQEIVMADYHNFINRINTAQKGMASFRRVVLHCHSPNSHDYRRTIACNPEMLIQEEKEYQAALKISDLDMVAITDHMKFDFACRLAGICHESPCVLPGVEMNLRPSPPWNTFKIHVVAIFPEQYSHEEICKILPAGMPSEAQRKGIEEIENVNISDFVTKIHGYGGICIAAHIDSNNGIRRTFRQLGQDGVMLYAPDQELSNEQMKEISDEFKDWILSARFDAIEVAKYSDKVHYTWISKIKGQKLVFPAILRNDSHHQSDINKPEYITHIKMTTVSYKDLVQALKFPETRIRFPNEVPATPSPRILGMEIISTDEKGFFKEVTLGFSDNLSCLIGPRGSGKSTIIEAMRYTLGLNLKFKEFEKAEEELASKARSLQKATLTNCIIHVAYLKKDGRTQILESTYDFKQDNMTKFYDVDGNSIEIVDIESNFPVRLFGWSEIEMLGRESNRQRELLDRLIPELNEMQLNQKALRQLLGTKKSDIIYSVNKLVSFVQKDNGEITKYREYKSDFEKLNTAEVDALFKDIDIAKNQNIILKKVKSNVLNLLNNIPESQAIELFNGINELLNEYPDPIKDWWVNHQRENKFKERETEIKEAIEKARLTITRFSDEMTRQINIINSELIDKESQLKEKIGVEAGKQVAADLRRIAGDRLNRVNQMRREYTEEWKKLQERIQQWKDSSLELTVLQQKISEKRAKRKQEIETDLNKFNNPKMKISIRFNENADKKTFTEHLYSCGLLTKDLNARWRSNVWAEKISMSCIPVEFAQCMLSKSHLNLKQRVTVDGKVYETETTMAEILAGAFYPFGEDNDAEIPIVDKDLLEKILTVAEIEWNDEEGILLNEKPIENCSPGQRSSAMLPLIALVEDTPLIIDQPEDNLDNSLVGKVLVDILAGLKEKRQIIVATHNPNIVVSGDAEQVIVMDALSDNKGICKEMGSIDNSAIVKSVVDIMEGGKEAFINRFKRYGSEVEAEVS